MLGGRGLRLVTTLAGALLAGPGTAIAAPLVTSAGGIKYVNKAVAEVQGYEELIVKCPKGTHVIGGGQLNFAPFQQLQTFHSFPADDGDKGKLPDDAWGLDLLSTNPITVNGFAICADVAVQYRTQKFTTPGEGEQSNQLLVSCPGEKQILGGGQRAPRDAAEMGSYPIADFWAAYVDSYASGQAKTKVTAICGRLNTKLVAAPTLVQPGSQQLWLADCPGSKHAYSGGQVNSGTWFVVGVNSGHPAPVGGGAPDEGWATTIENNSLSEISATATVVCGPSINQAGT